MDILANESTVHDLEELAQSVQEQGRVFITQAGFHPGLPAVFVRRGARYFDQYDKANIAMAMNARIERPEQAAEFIPLVADFTGDICRDGSWRKATYRDAVTFDMGSRFGTITLYPMKMAEIKLTQKMFNLSDTALYVSGFNWFVDYLVMPTILVTQKIKKGLATSLLAKLLTWGSNAFSSPNLGVVLMNDAEGWKDGKRIGVRIIAEHDDAYLFTAIPVVACLKQYFAGTLPPGLSMMGHLVDEDVLFSDMEKMGIR